MKKIVVSEEHVRNALDGYLKAMSMIDDDEDVIEVKRTRSNDYEITVEEVD